jgi:phospholipid N-methyltransferase
VTQRAGTGHAASQVNRPVEFFRGFLRQPAMVGAVVPSSTFLARRLADALRHAQTVVELGPGTGPVTHALLQVLPVQARLLAIELDPAFAAMLQAEADPRLLVHRGSATGLSQALAAHAIGQVDGVVSGIPFSTIGDAAGRSVLQQIWSALRPGGSFLAYQFRSDVARLAREVMGRPRMQFELRNVPPIRIYTWRKPATSEPQ